MPPRRARRPPTASATAPPRRTCIGCRQVRDVQDLVRIARRPDGSLGIGRTLPGRGAWLCAVPSGLECFELARRRRAFAKALHASIDLEAIDELHRALRGGVT